MPYIFHDGIVITVLLFIHIICIPFLRRLICPAISDYVLDFCPDVCPSVLVCHIEQSVRPQFCSDVGYVMSILVGQL